MEDYPRIRAIEMIPFCQEGKEMVLLRDPEGVMEEQLIVSRELAFVLLMMDGSRSLRDIQVEYMRAFGELIYTERLEEICTRLDERFLLHTPRYERRITELKDDYERRALRPPTLAGKSYPARPEELLEFLKSLFSRTEEGEDALIDLRGVLSPHIDYRRGGEVYAAVYPYLAKEKEKLVVIFGTSHRPLKRMWAVSLKDMESPLGAVKVPPALKEIIWHSPLARYVDEWPHRGEHSIELQLPLLQYFLGSDFSILPILMGNMDDFISGRRKEPDPEVEEVLTALRDCLKRYGRPYILLSAADLAHIGLQFGDLYPLNEVILERSKKRDEMLLERIRGGDARGFLRLIQEEGDSRRICGLAPIYFQLRMLEGWAGEILSYRQWSDGASSVSFAAGIFYDQKERGECQNGKKDNDR